eukprot:3441617-Amphidinium_carterae.1
MPLTSLPESRTSSSPHLIIVSIRLYWISQVDYNPVAQALGAASCILKERVPIPHKVIKAVYTGSNSDCSC